MNTSPEAEEQHESRYLDFLKDCLDGNLWENLTFEQWNRIKYRESLLSEYNDYCLQNLINANGDIKELQLHDGNFYDWMAEVKGIALTSDEEEMRIYTSQPEQTESPIE